MGERETGEGRSEQMKAVRSRQRRVACLPSGAMAATGPTSGFMVLTQQQSVMTSKPPITTESQEDRTTRSWPGPSLPATLGRAGLAPHRL